MHSAPLTVNQNLIDDECCFRPRKILRTLGYNDSQAKDRSS